MKEVFEGVGLCDWVRRAVPRSIVGMQSASHFRGEGGGQGEQSRVRRRDGERQGGRDRVMKSAAETCSGDLTLQRKRDRS